MKQHFEAHIGQTNMIKFSLLFLMVTSYVTTIAQIYETNPDYLRTKNWYFGDSVAIRFENKDSITNLNGFKGWTYEGTSILNNREGKLKYYSDGKFLYDKHSDILNPNDKFLSYNSSTQRVILSQFDKDTQFIHVFTTSPTFSQTDRGLRYSIYNSKLDSFVLINKLIQPNIGEKQASILHQNMKYIWHVSHKETSDTFFLFLLNRSNEALCCPVIQSIGSYYYDYFPSQGKLKFAPNGEFAINCNWDLFNFEILQFNSENGLFYNPKSVSANWPLSSEIIILPNKTVFLVTEERGKRIQGYEFNSLKDIDFITSSKKTIYNNGNSENIDDIQMGIYGDLYLTQYNETRLLNLKYDSINDTFSSNFVNLQNRSKGGLPNFNASYFYTPSIDFAYTEDCWEHSYKFEGRDTLKATSWKWIFRDVRNETVDVRLGKNVSYTFPQADSLENKYEVTHIASTASRSDTVTKTLTIRPKWDTDMLGRDTFYCEDTKANISLIAAPDMHCVHWNGEEPNLDESLGPIVDYDHFHSDTLVADTAGTYIVKVTNKTFCQMWDTLRVTEMPRPSKSVISRNGNTLKSSISANAYRWYFNGEIDTLTLQPFYVPMANGYWQVQLVSEFGCESELSDSLNVGFAALDHRYETLDFRLYPNPSDGHIFLQVPKEGEYRIQITDLNGKVVYSTTQNLSPRMSLFAAANAFASGNYIVTLINENGETGSKQITVR
jgi:hypothetical protein